MYKKIFALILAGTVILSVNLSDLWAQDNVHGSITYKTDTINPKDGKSFQFYEIYPYVTMGKLGLGTDVILIPRNDYTKVKPIVTWSLSKSLSLVGGFSTDSNGNDHVQAGVWYAAKVGKLSIFLDPRYYFELSDKADSFFDGFLEISYPLSDKVALGIDAVYDHWRDQDGSSWGLIGPIVFYRITDPVKVFARVARETDFKNSDSTDFRLGITWLF